MSYSLNNLDIKMLDYINYENGFFVECGANDGITQSNSYYYEKNLNWNGLLVEPIKSNYENCLKIRSAISENYALVGFDYTQKTISGDFIVTPDNASGLMAGITGLDKYYTPIQTPSIEVPCTTLHNLILKHNIESIDFFSLDVEGYEIEVLSGIDFNYIRPKYILIETANIQSYKNKVAAFMKDKNYKFVAELSLCDDLFIDSLLEIS